MAHDLKDLTAVMEAESARGVPSPDLLDGVRRRVRRGNRLRAAAAALGVVLVAGTAFGAVQRFGPGGSADPEQRGSAITGAVDRAFPKSRSVQGLKPVTERRFSWYGRLARITFTPTGPYTMFTTYCSNGATSFEVMNGDLANADCGGAQFMLTTPGVPTTVQIAVLPADEARRFDMTDDPAALDRYLAGREPRRGNWSVRVYSGPCTSANCKLMRRLAPAPQPPLTGLASLGRATGTADGRARTVPLHERVTALRLRVTCADGAAHAVVRIAGRAKVVECEAAESKGVVWDTDVPGGTDAVDVAVLPAEVPKVGGTDDAALAKAMKGVKPDGTWTLEVYAR
ncbi:hypothetical protein [Actinomadura montaniterrae]|uniref:Uncharacterized protein n=1 Tax=Actinomadura montaniterrae TaxID=1803903 RepID=A0A6L3VN70_9ACTN|nr:hypothetical protein [Actinomadura montaniterrae]KAB2372032.1 hypothetical protein F9B16_30660 [Actinomadura montaniterrae]